MEGVFMNLLHFTLLEKNQVIGNNQLEIFKEMGVQAKISDYAILSGGYIFDIEEFYIGDAYHLENRPGCYWTKHLKHLMNIKFHIVLPLGLIMDIFLLLGLLESVLFCRFHLSLTPAQGKRKLVMEY